MPSTRNATQAPSRGQPSWWQRLTQSIAAKAENAAYPERTIPSRAPDGMSFDEWLEQYGAGAVGGSRVPHPDIFTRAAANPDPRDAWRQTTGIIQAMNANVISRRDAMEELGTLEDMPKPWHLDPARFEPWHGLTDPDPLIVDDPATYNRGRTAVNTHLPNGLIPGPSGTPVIDPTWKVNHTTLTHDPTNDTFKVETIAPDGWAVTHTMAASAIRTLPQPENEVTRIAERCWKEQDKRYDTNSGLPNITYTPPNAALDVMGQVANMIRANALDMERKIFFGDMNTS